MRCSNACAHELDAYAPNKVLLAEANQWPEDVQAYFGSGDECHMAYHFPLMPRIYMAIAQEDRFPITDIMRQTPEIPANCQWAMFLRNHDELTLEMVTDAERDYLWSTYAADPRARINLGIRRRLAPLMENDRRKIELMNSILMSMPGTPIIYYGDEIGMGDNIYLGDRNGVRTPMQWTPDRNGGFSRADPARLFLPPNHGPGLRLFRRQRGGAGALAVVAAELDQAADRRAQVDQSVRARHAHLHPSGQPRGARLCAPARRGGNPLRRQYLALGAGGRTRPERVERPHPAGNAGAHQIPAHRRAALSDHAAALRLLLVPAAAGSRARAGKSAAARDHHAGARAERGRRPFELDAAHLRGRGAAAFHARPALVRRQGQPPARGQHFRRPSASSTADDRFAAVVADVAGLQGVSRYFLPLTIRWTRYTDVDRGPASVLAAVRRGPREGTLLDATAEPEFIAALLAKIHAGETVGEAAQRLEFRPTAAFAASALAKLRRSRPSSGEQSNTSVIADSKYVVKILRRITAGIHPEIEVGRFLADVAHFENAPTLLGSRRTGGGREPQRARRRA